jgi:hypothetical protein
MQTVVLYEIAEIRERLLSEINSHGSKSAFCRRIGIHIAHLNNVINQEDTIPLPILKRLKLYRVKESSENRIRAYVAYAEINWNNLWTEEKHVGF